MREGWVIQTLGECCQIKPSKQEARRRLSKNDLVSFVPMNVLGIREKWLKPTEKRPLESVAGSYTYFADGDVLLAKITPCFENGKLGIARGLTNRIGFGSSEFIVLRPNGTLDAEFLFYFLSQDSFRDAGANVMTGAVGHKRVPNEFIQKVGIPVPSLPEQKRIVAILDEAFAGIATAVANTEKNLANARELFESYLNAMFSQRGENWAETSLGDLCEKITKGSSPKWQGIKYQDRPGVLFVTSENVGRNELIFQKKKYVEEAFNKKDAKSVLREGDVLTNIVGASIGRTAVFDMPILANINQAVCLLRCKPEKLNSHFLAHLLNSPFLRRVLHENEIDNARANLSLGFFRQLSIPYPAIANQEEIVRRIDRLAAECKALESTCLQKRASLAELKQSLLKKAFSGELTADKDASDVIRKVEEVA